MIVCFAAQPDRLPNNHYASGDRDLSHALKARYQGKEGTKRNVAKVPCPLTLCPKAPAHDLSLHPF